MLRRVKPASAAAPAGQTWEVEVGVMQASPVAADIVVAAEAEVVAASAVAAAVVAEQVRPPFCGEKYDELP